VDQTAHGDGVGSGVRILHDDRFSTHTVFRNAHSSSPGVLCHNSRLSPDIVGGVVDHCFAIQGGDVQNCVQCCASYGERHSDDLCGVYLESGLPVVEEKVVAKHLAVAVA